MRDSNSGSEGLGEIGLADLFKGVLAQRWLVIAVTVVITLMAGAFAYLSQPVYEARAYVLPPTQNDIEDFNYGRTPELGFAPYSVRDVYAVFIRNLQSESLKNRFFNEVYLPSLSDDARRGSQDYLYRKFTAALTIAQPSKDFSDRFTVVALNNQPVQAANWLNLYIDQASDAAKKELIKNFSKEIKIRIRNNETQISMMRENAANVRQDTIRQLLEAEKVAGSIGLEKHQIIAGGVAGEMSGAGDSRLIYLRGTKALEAEVKTLQARESDDAFIANLRKLQGMNEFYKTLGVKAEDVAVYRLDGVIQPPDTPIKPKKALILLLGMIVGLGLGLVLGLMRHFWTVRKPE
ncbi:MULTISPECIES: LPS O-antigen chain length determinant protein WzzB [Pseudomonas]|jgi:chain length determinant protein (polysaccharide antigen chain regulator)|uniref:Chain-length determining protein n=2 Tax=Pseudomonas TaxID=286 RepID=A0AB36D593_9PSED|nr:MULTISPECIES: Wzz/FepE/Etk N-terminal domain-containing protein [Pseudomonas]MBU0521392.1 chain-length determining protein [Gammaproteobacteria bacterium]MBU0820832.1 chain-length determining protein [Gammaproteobacteria bacterium]MBU0841406.1 chain-length determining protein [Gammaproteobacteria bacterium]MBU1840531.1 chain-length determining protein [Gammaproteobacteria bacterium]NMZ83238.1 chain-length determining protein [Pseudomonas mandelii]